MKKTERELINCLAESLSGFIVHHPQREINKNANAELKECWKKLALYDMFNKLHQVESNSMSIEFKETMARVSEIIKSCKQMKRAKDTSLLLPQSLHRLVKSCEVTTDSGGSAWNNGCHTYGFELKLSLSERHDFVIAYMAWHIKDYNTITRIFNDIQIAYKLMKRIVDLLPAEAILYCENTMDHGVCIMRNIPETFTEEQEHKALVELQKNLKPWKGKSSYEDFGSYFHVYFNREGYTIGRLTQLRVPANTDMSFLAHFDKIRKAATSLHKLFTKDNGDTVAIGVLPVDYKPWRPSVK